MHTTLSDQGTIKVLAKLLDVALDTIDRRDAIIADRDATVAGLMAAQDGFHRANEAMHECMCNANLRVTQLESELREARK
jgi:hypothetical protein